VRHDVDGSILLNPDKKTGMKGRPIRVGLAIRRLCVRQHWRDIPNRENERARPKRAFEESATAYIFDLRHAIFPAASLIAWRIRW
jgi:hypothetical protein